MIILYEHPLSPYAQKVKIALREKEIPFDARLPEGIGAGTTAGAFAEANPRGEVPAILHEGRAIFDSTIILEYIEDTWPSPGLKAATPIAQARARMIEDVMDTHFEAISWALGEIEFFKRAEGDLRDRLVAAAAEQIEGFFSWLNRELGDDAWFTGENFGWADLSVVPYLNGVAGFGFEPEPGSPLANWLQRANARSSVALTAEEARSSVGDMEQVNAAVDAGLFKRQYRDHRLEWMVKSGGIEIVLKGLEKGNIRFTEGFD